MLCAAVAVLCLASPAGLDLPVDGVVRAVEVGPIEDVRIRLEQLEQEAHKLPDRHRRELQKQIDALREMLLMLENQ